LAGEFVWPQLGSLRRVTALGAYGFALTGVEQARRWLVDQTDDAPHLNLVRVLAPLPDRPPVIDAHHADLGLIEGVWFQADAASETVTFTAPRQLDDAELVHPFLAPAAALQWLWRGREVLHAGAVLLGGGAVLLLGDKAAGKSTTLAHLAAGGHPVLTDDMVVVSAALTMPPGPRGIDRRPGLGPMDEPVRGGERDRLWLGPAPVHGEIPIRAVVRLSWGPDLTLRSLSAAERLSALATSRRVRRLAGHPETILELAALPAYGLQRPWGDDQISRAVALLLRSLG
jgi:hypothetical protein